MRYAIFVLICAVAVMPMMGCPPGPTDFRVLSPTANATESQQFTYPGGKLEIEVEFSEDVWLSSIIAGDNVVLDTNLYSDVDIIITHSGLDTILITTVADYGDLLNFAPNAFFDLYIQPSGSSKIEALSGDKLDGDGDGREGGAWETSFLFLGK